MISRKNNGPLGWLRFGFAIGLMAFSLQSFGQDEAELKAEIIAFQHEQNEHYLSKKSSPLSKKERKAFHGHSFYPIDLSYRVEAKFDFIVKEDTVEMATSAGNIKYYRPYALLSFKIAGVDCQLTAYQSLKLRETEEYKDFIFVPFRDLTSGNESYGGGRYLDLIIPDGESIILNFNLAYNPYCAYTTGYNCTIPPKENTLSIAIRAGLMAPTDH